MKRLVALALISTAAHADPTFMKERISAHIRFLADDLLEGRATGERGHRVAAAYVASELSALGVEPAGDQGTYFQAVSARAARLESATLEIAGVGPLANEKDFAASPDLATGHFAAEGKLAFVSYAIKADAYRYDDLDAIDVKGKIAVVLVGAPIGRRPDFFPDTPSGVASDRATKIDELAARGARGVIFVRTPRNERQSTWERVIQSTKFEYMVRVDGGKLARGNAFPRVTVQGAVFDKMLAAAGRSERTADLVALAEAGKPRTFDLPLATKLDIRSTTRELETANVIGHLPGTTLRDEAVMLSAHLDHVGIGPAVNGDTIYNGAGDDAAGCAMVLEMARVFAAQKRTHRSLYFVFFTGEEKGLIGSEAFAEHPPLPIDHIVADINSDMATYPTLRLRDIEPLGAEHSTLAMDVDKAARETGITISADSQPEETRFIRSDHYSLVRKGIPAIYPMVGYRGASAEEVKAQKDFEKLRYHQPADEWEPNRDFQPLADFARFQYLVARSVADRAERPRWNAGDFFQIFVPKR